MQGPLIIFTLLCALLLAAFAGSCANASARTHARGTNHHLANADRFNSLAEVTSALREAGLESSNLIVGIDFTASNSSREQSARTFGGRPLHTLLPAGENLYEQALGVIARTLESFDEDGEIPAFGFGCTRTHGDSVFSFLPNASPCQGLAGVKRTYRAVAPLVKQSGPTSFGPIIRKAIEIVRETRAYHILVVLADGQITRSKDTPASELSPFEEDTISAIVEASHFPLSIVVIGIGDGPWETMEEFDDKLPARAFDNFQFVDFEGSRQSALALAPRAEPARTAFVESMFARDALMEIPSQFTAVARHVGRASNRDALPAVRTMGPPSGAPSPAAVAATGRAASPASPPAPVHAAPTASVPSAAHPARGGASPAREGAPSSECTICLERPVNAALIPCGHTLCSVDAENLRSRGAPCPLCRARVTGVQRVFL
jgi:E3 ubiquitin-protein ligase RGLG